MKEPEILVGNVGNIPDTYSWKDSLLPRGPIHCPSLTIPNREEHSTLTEKVLTVMHVISEMFVLKLTR